MKFGQKELQKSRRDREEDNRVARIGRLPKDKN